MYIICRDVAVDSLVLTVFLSSSGFAGVKRQVSASNGRLNKLFYWNKPRGVQRVRKRDSEGSHIVLYTIFPFVSFSVLFLPFFALFVCLFSDVLTIYMFLILFDCKWCGTVRHSSLQ